VEAVDLDHIQERIKDARAEVLLVAETHRMPAAVREELHRADEHLQKALALLTEVEWPEE